MPKRKLIVVALVAHAAGVTAQRDSLTAEAGRHFANDPKTRDAVINLLSSETTKRATMIRH